MRRRQLYASQAAIQAALSSLAEAEARIDERVEEEKAAVAQLAVSYATLPRGACQKCGRHIGQGLAMHRKSCKGVADG
jgi:hypothetical protein